MVEVTARLLSSGYVEDGVSPEGLGHRYRHATVQEATIDLLLPEGMKDTAKYRTATGAKTIEVPGSVQALERSLRRAVTVNGIAGAIIRPDVHAAMVLKAAAYQDEAGTTRSERHLRDFAVLVSLYARHYPHSELLNRLTKEGPVAHRQCSRKPCYRTTQFGDRDRRARSPGTDCVGGQGQRSRLKTS
jgi:hypothetical protein